MAPEIIDLVSDSDDSDESPRKAATSTLQAFGPRKEKVISTRNGTQPAFTTAQHSLNGYAHPHAPPRSIAPSTAPATTPRASIQDNASLAEILRRSTQHHTHSTQSSATRPPPATAPASRNGSLVHQAPRQAEYQAPPAKRQSTGSVSQSSDPRRRSGPLHEERQRRYEEYHRKEAERARAGDKAQKVNTKAAALSNPRASTGHAGATPSVKTNARASLSSSSPHSSLGQNEAAHSVNTNAQTQSSSSNSHSAIVQLRAPPSAYSLKRSGRSSSPASAVPQPESKRLKQDHDEGVVDDVEIGVGMREARRLSAAAIPDSPDFSTSKSIADPALSNSHSSVNSVPDPPAALSFNDSNGDSATSHKLAVIGKAQYEVIDLTEESPNATVQPPENTGGAMLWQPAQAQDKVHSKVAIELQSLSASSSDGEESSPDEIPARARFAGLSKGKGREAPVRQKSPSPSSTDASLGAAAFEETSIAQPRLPNGATTETTETHMDVDAIQSEDETERVLKNRMHASKRTAKSFSKHLVQYTPEEDDLLAFLREERNVGWDIMPSHFIGRTQGSLQVRYSTKVKNRHTMATRPQGQASRKMATSVQTVVPQSFTARQEYTAPSRRQPRTALKNDGFLSWADIKAKRLHGDDDGGIQDSALTFQTPPVRDAAQEPGQGLDVAHPSSLSRLLRCREIGNTSGRNWSSTARAGVPDELQNHILDTLGPSRFFHGASRDVTCVAWANDGNSFAAGAIAIDDERSMQYNRPNNLLLGKLEQNSLTELPEHHVTRPIVNDSQNVNSLHAMQESQDPRLFKTVAAVTFSNNSKFLYSAGGDGMVRMYDTAEGKCLSSYKHEGELALLTTNSKDDGLLASACHRSGDASISIFRCHDDRLDPISQIGPSRTDVESSLPIFPSALKWGTGIYGHLLLAGFSSDSIEEDRLSAGEVCLWDSTANHKIDLPTLRGVFDVAWNPLPSSGSSLFAVACTRTGKRYRSSIKCFAPNQRRASCVLEWECPAFDINDVVYCPHDDNIIAAGATDSKVYIWDKRCAGRSSAPLHIFSHDETKNVLDHERDREIADTGVRFLSWSATGNRLYSGSSDGTVKIWNPYRTTEDALVRNVATFNSAVMSGAFSPDYRDLLIGEDQGQLNLLGIDREERSVRRAKKFDLFPAPAPTTSKDDKLLPARELLATQQIEIRPMGVLPVKQAVQGPNYRGPFMGPSSEEINRLHTEKLPLEQTRARLTLPWNEDAEKAFRSAEARMRQIREALDRFRRKQEDTESLKPEAERLQKKYREERHALKKEMLASAIKSCKLDCNYLPAAGDDDGEAPDNHRSEQRIPFALRSEFYDTADMTNAEIAEAGLTSKCSSCKSPAAKHKERGLSLCGRCTLTRSGLTARCQKCAAPVRPNLDERVRNNICERCDFHCFRCGQVAHVSSQGDITCELCGVQWEAGVLGYKVKRAFKPSGNLKKQEHERVMESLEQRMGRLFGDDERERLAGGWKVALLDGPSE